MRWVSAAGRRLLNKGLSGMQYNQECLQHMCGITFLLQHCLGSGQGLPPFKMPHTFSAASNGMPTIHTVETAGLSTDCIQCQHVMAASRTCDAR